MAQPPWPAIAPLEQQGTRGQGWGALLTPLYSSFSLTFCYENCHIKDSRKTCAVHTHVPTGCMLLCLLSERAPSTYPSISPFSVQFKVSCRHQYTSAPNVAVISWRSILAFGFVVFGGQNLPTVKHTNLKGPLLSFDRWTHPAKQTSVKI